MAAIVSMLIATAGAVSFNWHGDSWINGNAQVGGASVLGWNYHNMSYNATPLNRTEALKQIATVSQCRTDFVDTAAPIASNALKISLNTSEVNQANSELQADIKSNASNPTIRADILVFDGSVLRLFGQAISASRDLNSTQIQTLKAQLNSSVETLQSCTSGNASGKWFMVPRLGFFRGLYGFFQSHMNFHGWR